MLEHNQELMFMEAEYVIISYLTNQPKVATAALQNFSACECVCVQY